MTRSQRLVVSFAVFVLLMSGCRQEVRWLPDPQWAHVPVTVSWDDVPPAFESSMKGAMGAWNYAAGCPVIVKADGAANVTISAYDGFFCGKPAQLEETRGAVAGFARCDADHGEIKFAQMTDLRSAYEEIAHEEGHMLGLDHNRSRLMQAARQAWDPAATGGLGNNVPVWPSDADGAAIKQRYCR